jgi:hypothetical protein
MSDIVEFSFDDSKAIKTNAIEAFKQTRNGEKNRVSVVAFKKFSDTVIAQKAREKGSALTEQEKLELITKIDKKLAEQLGKSVEALTEADRLDIKSPRFAFAWTHYRDGIGGFKCLSTYEGSTVVKPEICCNKFGDADQTVGTIIMTYPVKDGLQVDEELLAARKYVNFHSWKMSAKKFKKIEDAYREARGDEKYTIDLSVTLDGDPKYQKQVITGGSSAVWARGKPDSEVRSWILDQGLRAWKHVPGLIGFELKKEKLLEKMGISGGSQQLPGGHNEDSPRLVSSYDDLIA